MLHDKKCKFIFYYHAFGGLPCSIAGLLRRNKKNVSVE